MVILPGACVAYAALYPVSQSVYMHVADLGDTLFTEKAGIALLTIPNSWLHAFSSLFFA